jgi:hypothetical protein
MGAGASTLPGKLKEEDLQHVVHELFDSFKDSEGLVDKELLIAAAFSGQEQEVYDLYMKYSKNGNMDAKGFHDFCVTSKILNRSNFTVADSVRIFQKSIVTVSASKGSTVQSINYPTFRKYVLIDVADKKEIHIDNLVFKLSRIEANPPRLIAPKEEEKKKKKVKKMKSKPEEEFDFGVPIVDCSDEVDEAEDPLTPLREIGQTAKDKAAVRIQSLSRMRTASRYVNELREINSLHQLHDEPEIVDIPPTITSTSSSTSSKPQTTNQTKSEVEKIIQSYYHKFTLYSHPDQIDLTHFMKFCHDCGIIQKRFTIVDAELAFLRAKKKASISAKEEYKTGVFFDKRINYLVFRDILLRCIAEKLNQPIDVIIHHVINAAKR